MATIKLKRGTSAPTTSNIVDGEVAVDKTTQKLYLRDGSTIKEIGTGITGDATFAGTITGAGPWSLTHGSTPYLDLKVGSTMKGRFYADANQAIIEAVGNSLILKSASTTALTLNSSQDATFAGTVTATGTSSTYLTSGYVARLYGGTQTYLAFNNSTHTTQVMGGFVIGNDASAARLIQRENQPITFLTNNVAAPRLTIAGDGVVTTSGELVVGGVITGNNQNMTISSGNTYHVYNGGYKFYVTSAGQVNYTSLLQLSDEREKKNIEAMGPQWDALKQWDLKKFHFKTDEDSDSKRHGIIAQDVEVNHPDLVSDFKLTETVNRKGVKEQEMMWIAVKALQEALTRIETLEARVAFLET